MVSWSLLLLGWFGLGSAKRETPKVSEVVPDKFRVDPNRAQVTTSKLLMFVFGVKKQLVLFWGVKK